jgi:hypothetical protein
MCDNKVYNIKLPQEAPQMLEKFEELVLDIRHFNIHKYKPDNESKCRNCIYEPLCDKSVIKC